MESNNNINHCKAEKFKTKVVRRSQLKGAPYNPRILDDEARAKLRNSLSTIGMVMPIVWNERSGNIVGGHQRLRELDDIQGDSEYTLTISAVDIDDKTEKELNIFLNNTYAQGDWDLEKLKELLGDIDVDNTGFDMADVFQMFGEAPETEAYDDAVSQIATSIQNLKDQYDELSKKMALKDESDFYNVLVFKSESDRAELAKILDVEDNRYIDGMRFLRLAKEILGKGSNTSIGGEINRADSSGLGENKAEPSNKPRGGMGDDAICNLDTPDDRTKG
jgi:hypothetical protein